MKVNRYEIKPGANLRRADLRDADLRDANLFCADLRNADLRYANLRGADLRDANLRDANLRHANLCDADLRNADLRYATFRRADLRRADLRRADLLCANLCDAVLSKALGLEQTYVAPQTGAFDCFKKCLGNVIVKLRVPAKARRSNATGRKCRAEFAKVLAVYGAEVGISQYRKSMHYIKGDTVHCDAWCDDRWNECAGGIHFFMTRQEAEQY